MFVVRDVFVAKPGRAKDLVAKFKQAAPRLRALGLEQRVMTDAVASYWTVVVESEVESLDNYFGMARGMGGDQQLGEIMQGYMDLVEGGRREIFKIE
jgi:hypothetical protein